MFYSEHSWNWADGDTLSLKMGGTCVFFRPISWIRLFYTFDEISIKLSRTQSLVL